MQIFILYRFKHLLELYYLLELGQKLKNIKTENNIKSTQKKNSKQLRRRGVDVYPQSIQREPQMQLTEGRSLFFF